MDEDWGYLPISRLAHAEFCMRRAALITLEQAWAENADTAKGRIEHARVHDGRMEHRGDRVLIYEQTVYSDSLGIQGKCDCVEAIRDERGCMVGGIEFPVRLYPVEHKHGSLRDESSYELQLCAQAMCMEEMYGTHIPEGAIFYISSHRRKAVELTDELRDKVRQTVTALTEVQRRLTVPAAQYTAKCRKCSLYDLCMPQGIRSAEEYCKQIETEAKAGEVQ